LDGLPVTMFAYRVRGGPTSAHTWCEFHVCREFRINPECFLCGENNVAIPENLGRL